MTLSDHQQRLLDQQEGAAMDRRAARRERLARRPLKLARVQVRDDHGQVVPRVTLTLFLKDNAFEPEERRALIADLRRGVPAMVGGGAAPLIRVERTR